MAAWRTIPAAICGLAIASVASAQSGNEFYKGKTVTIIVGTAAGGDYDLWARLIGRYMRKYIPGSPTFIAQNMPGSGFIVAANHLYNIARRDGTVIGMTSRNIPYNAVQGLPNVRYDALKFQWLGNPEAGNRVCFARADSGIARAEDLFERELIVAGTGVGSGISATPMLLKNLLGMKFKIVEGYSSVDDGALAMERGEVAGICETWTAFNKRRPNWIRSGFARALFNMEETPLPGQSFPTIHRFLKSDGERAIVSFYASSIYLGRPMLAPPEVPFDRVAMLRQAFDAAIADPAFVNETKQLGLELSPSSGGEVEARVRAVVAASPDLVKQTELLTTRK
jgi:tripartite-type tricarboxylate transporter receptor subunit TctC